jgi:hypothetical protein
MIFLHVTIDILAQILAEIFQQLKSYEIFTGLEDFARILKNMKIFEKYMEIKRFCKKFSDCFFEILIFEEYQGFSRILKS